MSLMEQSAFYDYFEREKNPKPLIRGDETTLPSSLKADQITHKFMKSAKRYAKFDVEILNKELIRDFKSIPLTTPITICAKYSDSFIPNLRRKRILRELHEAAFFAKQESDIRIYPFQSNIEIWEAFIKGPYKWWQLIIRFPELYPFQPPIIKFITVPYHLNISIDGQICIHILEKGYSPSCHVVYILGEIYDLFFHIDSKTKSTNKKLNIYTNNRDKYHELVKESADANNINDLDEFLNSYTIEKDEPEGFLETTEKKLPSYLFLTNSDANEQVPSQIDKTQEEKNGKESITYDINELRKLVTANENPIALITEKDKTDLDDDQI